MLAPQYVGPGCRMKKAPVPESEWQRMIDRIADAMTAIDFGGPRVRLDWANPWHRRGKFFAGFTLKTP